MWSLRTVTDATELRPRATAWAFCGGYLLTCSYGLGPFFVSLLILSMGGRLPAFNVALAGWFVASAIMLMVCFTIERDVHRQIAMVKAQINKVVPAVEEGRTDLQQT